MSVKNVPQNNNELRQMAKEALDNWLFDEETDPHGYIKVGLEYYVAEGEAVPDNDVPNLFARFKGSLDEWDILEELAKGIGSQQ